MLLHASMQVALDSASVGVRGEDEPLPRRAQLGDFGAQSLECLSEPFVLVGSQLVTSSRSEKFSVIAPAASSGPPRRAHGGQPPEAFTCWPGSPVHESRLASEPMPSSLVETYPRAGLEPLRVAEAIPSGREATEDLARLDM